MADAVTTRRSRWFSRWKGWGDGSVNRRILAAILTVGIATAAVKLLTVPKEVLVAYRFGVGDALDAFLIAFLVPSFATNVVADSFNAAFVPTFVRVLERDGDARARQLFESVAILALVLLLAFALLLALAAPALMSVLAGGFSPAKRALTLELFYLLLPVVVLHGTVMLCAGVLNANERFGLAALTPAATPLAVIALLVVGVPGWGIFAVAAGTLAGTAIELAVLVAALQRRGFALRPRWHGWDDDLRAVMRQYGPVVAAAAAMCSTLLVDHAMAAWLPSGSVAALSFGGKVPALLTTIGSMALGTAVLPHFSRQVAAGDYAGIHATLHTYARLILWITIPVTLVGVAASEPIVRVLFERGAFSMADTALVAGVQAFLFLGFPAYLLCILGVRLLSAMSKNHVLAYGSALNFLVNIAGNYILMQLFGVAGIALSTSIVLVMSAGFVFYFLNRQLRHHGVG